MTIHADVRTDFRVNGLSAETARALRAGGPDAYGRPAERRMSGSGAPIFVCAGDCAPWSGAGAPAMFLGWERLLIRGYGADERIVYGTGRVVATADLTDAILDLLAVPHIAWVDLRSATNNCWQARAVRA